MTVANPSTGSPHVYLVAGEESGDRLGAALIGAFDGLDAAEVFRTSAAELVAGPGPAEAFRLAEVPDVAIEPQGADGCKCARCWRILEEVSPPKMLCLRCDEAVADWDEHHPAEAAQ